MHRQVAGTARLPTNIDILAHESASRFLAPRARSWWRPYCRLGLAAGAAGRPRMCWISVFHPDMAPQRRICCCPPLGTNAGVNDRSFEGKRRARSRPLRAKSRSRAVSAPMPSRKLTHPPARSWRSMTPNALSAKRWPPATPGETCSRVREKKSRFSGPYYPLVVGIRLTTLRKEPSTPYKTRKERSSGKGTG